MILILDYGAGNLRSVQHAFDSFGVATRITSDASEIATAQKVLLPGVGAFGKGIEAVRHLRFDDALAEHVDKGRDLLGICLGMQLLFESSTELGEHTGLGFLKGHVVRFENTGEKVPHVGWNSIARPAFEHPPLPGAGLSHSEILKGIADGTHFYFVHSFYCEPSDEGDVIARTSYAGKNFAAVARKNRIFGAQFHPEKSSSAGLQLLENFARL
ncbi:MAG: imidazole glycerol phosphate synthase subunit HisH [Rhizobacter sp.]|nr:imidazole glycerol phosphate synthase subunit HisH [Chlorobiales bacterium]